MCSIPLSSKDLVKRTEKELEKWRKDRPSSTFDPRGRCYGYQMAWTKAREKEEEQDRKEREKGNLSVPLGRSASTLSLSPSLLHKKWKKGGKVNTGDWVGGNKVVRHFSMGAKEDWRSSTDFNFKKVQDLQEEEDIRSEQHKTQSESKLAEETNLHELSGDPKTKNTPKEHIEEKVMVEEQPELSDQTAENTVQPTKLTSHCEQKEKPETTSQSQVLEEQSQRNNSQQSDVKDRSEETDTPVTDEHTTAVEDNSTEIQGEALAGKSTEVERETSEEPMIQADVKPTEGTETENMQQVLVATATEASETRSETSGDEDVETSTVKDQHPTTDAQQGPEKVITKTKEDESEGEHHCTEPSAETEKKETHSQTETETDVCEEVQEETEEHVATKGDANVDRTQTDTEKHLDSETETKAESKTLLSSSEGNQQKEDTGTQTEAEVAVSQEMVNESNETTAVGSVHEREENPESVHKEMPSVQTNAEETQTKDETADTVTLKQDEGLNHTTESEFSHRSSAHVNASEMQAPELPLSQVPSGAEGEAEHAEHVKELTAGEDGVFSSAEATDSTLSDSNKHGQVKDSSLAKDQPAPHTSSLEQTCEYRSSRSSGDFCVRKSSNSRDSRLARRLSEDLFTTPQKTDQSQFPPNRPESQHRPVSTAQTAPDVTPTVGEVKDEAKRQEQQPHSPKRFGLLRKLRGEVPKNTKADRETKMQVPKILIQDFSDETGAGKPVEVVVEGKMNSKERRRRRRERERREKEEERMKKKKEKGLEKERKKPQTRGKSFQANKEKSSADVACPEKTGPQTLRYSASYAESYF